LGLAAGLALAPALADDLTSPGTPERFDGQCVVRVTPRGVADVRLMEQVSDDRWTCGPGGPNGEADYRVSTADLHLLDRAGVQYRVIVPDVQKLIDEAQADMSDPFQDRAFFDNYQNYASVSTYVDSLVASYPGFVTRFNVGNSIQSRSIFGFRVTSPVAPVGGSARKPVILFNSEQHAREWIAVMVDLYIATQFLSNYATDATTRRILDTYEIDFVPMCNPDGYNITWTTNRLWRKNARVVNGSLQGVDLNRNWSVGYGLNSGSSSSPGSDGYRGTGPFSEPESTLLSNYIVSIPKLAAHIDFHSYSQLVLRPWTYQYAQPAGVASFNRIGADMTAAITSATGAGYVYGGPEILYLASGTMPDWVFGTTNATALTIELRDTGRYGFVLPTSYIIPTGTDALSAAVAMITHLCPADLNRDNVVDDQDFVLFANAYDLLATNAGDFTGDGLTDDNDFAIFVIAYNQLTCP
jgi:murein tripeptide amidase MpaA